MPTFPSRPSVNPIDRAVTWLAQWNEAQGVSMDAAIMKLTEENGEVMTEWFAVNGYNPRKGVYSSRDEVAKELCDVIISALVALQRLGYDPQVKVAERAVFVQRRIQSTGSEN